MSDTVITTKVLVIKFVTLNKKYRVESVSDASSVKGDEVFTYFINQDIL